MKKILLLTVILICVCNYAFANDISEYISKAVKLYNDKLYKESAEHFRRASESIKNKNSDTYYKLKYNEAVCLYKNKNFLNSAKIFEEVLKADNIKLQQKSYYNAANALIKNIKATKGHSSEISKQLNKALKYYKNAILLNPEDNDAKRNYEIALKMKKQMNKSDNNNQNKNKQKNNKEENKDNKNKKKQNKKNKNKDKNNNRKKNDDNNKQDKKQKNKNDKKQNKKKNNFDNQTVKNQNDKKKNMKQTDKKQLTKEEIERILKAMEDEEKANRKKVKIYTGQEIKTDRDW
jgi:hypothetical protein